MRADKHQRVFMRAQLAEAIPVPGSGLTLPLDLHAIGARCTNAYYAPRRFAAVQLAFSNPRCRVLIFRKPHFQPRTSAAVAPRPHCALADTGRLVGTGWLVFSAAFVAAFHLLALRVRHRLQRAHGSAPGHPQGGAAAGGGSGRARDHSQVLCEPTSPACLPVFA